MQLGTECPRTAAVSVRTGGVRAALSTYHKHHRCHEAKRPEKLYQVGTAVSLLGIVNHPRGQSDTIRGHLPHVGSSPGCLVLLCHCCLPDIIGASHHQRAQLAIRAVQIPICHRVRGFASSMVTMPVEHLRSGCGRRDVLPRWVEVVVWTFTTARQSGAAAVQSAQEVSRDIALLSLWMATVNITNWEKDRNNVPCHRWGSPCRCRPGGATRPERQTVRWNESQKLPSA